MYNCTFKGQRPGRLELRDRFLGDEVWETLGLPVEECKKYVDRSDFMKTYRTALFSRIVPTMADWEIYPRIAAATAEAAHHEGLAALWPGREVEMHNVRNVLFRLRRKLRGTHRFEAIVGEGYRLVKGH